MLTNSYLQILFYIVVLLACVKPLGWYMARVYANQSVGLNRVFSPVERLIYRLSGVNPAAQMNWKVYTLAVLLFNVAGLLVVYGLQRVQGSLPLNPQGLPNVAADSALNTAISFASNTNWQGYGGESTMSYFTQMLALTVQNFVSAATGMAVLIALIRGLSRHTTQTLGNFWVDLVRTILYILLPLSMIVALLLVSQGMVQTFDSYKTVTTLEGAEQTMAVGPAASQVAIKQLGTNGGGFFNVNSAHPLENPTPITNFIQMLLILLIPAA
ncbi:MAG: potassium-transporting ATPase subunit KdpA, partial [Anaerolineae bacterium]|nr:potassium-transporting ATPase subunit KdpA [Anaerolineae bacterium]